MLTNNAGEFKRYEIDIAEHLWNKSPAPSTRDDKADSVVLFGTQRATPLAMLLTAGKVEYTEESPRWLDTPRLDFRYGIAYNERGKLLLSLLQTLPGASSFLGKSEAWLKTQRAFCEDLRERVKRA